jgi:hypothetical protein
MKYRILFASLVGLSFVFATLTIPTAYAQEAPETQSNDSVAKPKKPDNDTPPPEEAPIPSEYKRAKDPDVPKDAPTFRSNATTVSVDVAILDDHDRFIPQLPRDRFRILEDGVPQQITQFGTGEAPLTVCMVIE